MLMSYRFVIANINSKKMERSNHRLIAMKTLMFLGVFDSSPTINFISRIEG